MGGVAYDETVGKPGEVAASIDINLKCECRSGEIHLEIYSTRLLSPVLQSLATLLFVEGALWIVQPFQDHCSTQSMTVPNDARHDICQNVYTSTLWTCHILPESA